MRRELGRVYKRELAREKPGMEGREPLVWLPCDFLRHVHRQECIIRLHSTGAIVQIRLDEPLDVTRACLVCALKPAPGRVQLGEPGEKDGVFAGSVLEVDWPVHSHRDMPPPIRYVRVPRQTQSRKKRPRTAC